MTPIGIFGNQFNQFIIREYFISLSKWPARNRLGRNPGGNDAQTTMMDKNCVAIKSASNQIAMKNSIICVEP